MQGTHTFQANAKSEIDLETFVADDHLLRKVDQVLDLTFVRELTAPCYSQLGTPSIDPEVFFRMQLVAYLYGITSDRRLCEEVRYNLAYRWFCRLSLGDPVPDHSSIGRIRDRYGEAIFETVFRRIVLLCKKKGMVSQECRVMTDATLIAADASLNSLIHNDPAEADKEAESQQRDRGLKDGSSARRVSNKTHTSRTDPDATLAQKKGSPRQLKYKVHQTIDADSRVILDTEVTTGARHDNQPYLGQLQRICDCYQVTIREATADRGYGSAAIIRTLQQQGTTNYIPLWSGRVGNSNYLKSGLIYEKEHDRFRGRSKVQIQAYLSAMAQNLKRLVLLFYLWLNARRRVRQKRYPELVHLIPAARLLQHARWYFDTSCKTYEITRPLQPVVRLLVFAYLGHLSMGFRALLSLLRSPSFKPTSYAAFTAALTIMALARPKAISAAKKLASSH